jgi:hypothetical protein
MALFRALGALAFVMSVALLAFDAAHGLKFGRLETTSFEQFWATIGGERLFALRLELAQWLGSAADHVVELPAAVVVFLIGVAVVLVCDRAAPAHQQQLFAY